MDKLEMTPEQKLAFEGFIDVMVGVRFISINDKYDSDQYLFKAEA